MKRNTRIILGTVESDPGMTAHDIARKLDMNVQSVAKTLAHLYRQGKVSRTEERERYCYHPIKKETISSREKVSEETNDRYMQYQKTKTVGNRAYTCTHMDMLKILASQGDMKAYQEIKRREMMKG